MASSARSSTPRSDVLAEIALQNLAPGRRQRDVINEAADAAKKGVSAFVLDAVLADADRISTDRRIFELNDERWEASRPRSIPT